MPNNPNEMKPDGTTKIKIIKFGHKSKRYSKNQT